MTLIFIYLIVVCVIHGKLDLALLTHIKESLIIWQETVCGCPLYIGTGHKLFGIHSRDVCRDICE
jgi:hypothetical protein